jgi:DNA mismatch repair protein MutS2
MNVTPQTLSSLGFDEVRAAIAQRCRTDVGRARAAVRPFLLDHEEVMQALRLVEEARALKNEPLSLPLAGVADARAPVDRAARGAMLEPPELVAICRTLFAFERTAEVLHERREKVPGLAAVGQRVPTLSRLATLLDRSFENSGEISDRASGTLRDARERARGLHRRIRARLDELLADEHFGVNLQEQYYSLRHDRYVVPVKSSHQREVTGIVHNASQSGQTLFVEPQEMISLGNELAIAQSLVLEEERRVLVELSALVGREATAIAEGVAAAAELDELEGASALCEDLLASAPLLEPSSGALALRGLRHPRLVLRGGEVVANTVELTGSARVLVVSGPNAGGKTVTLTAVGLCALMVRAGLPIPCDPGSTIPLFDEVHSAIGDQQDLQQGLSTFSAHVTMLRDITAATGPGSLVLIDEIAADTDPREGAAIATAVLEALVSKGALVLVTTHLEELKALAHLDAHFVNARVGFDPRRMSPTFRLQLGLAGASSAIEIARRVGLPEAICERAGHLVHNTGGAFSKALDAAEAERRKLVEERELAAKAAAEATELRASLERELTQARRTRQEEELRFHDALTAELHFARQQLRALNQRLEADRSALAAKGVQTASVELGLRADAQASAARVLRAERSGPAAEPGLLRIEVGARARHKALQADVEVIEVSSETVTVAMGALKMRVSPSELGPPAKAAKDAHPSFSPRREERLRQADSIAAKALTLASPTLDVRGERAEDALRQLEQFLDRATQNGEEAVVVIHGHGTGALKASLREALARSPYARSFRSGDASEGGDGATVVLLS